MQDRGATLYSALVDNVRSAFTQSSPDSRVFSGSFTSSCNQSNWTHTVMHDVTCAFSYRVSIVMLLSGTYGNIQRMRDVSNDGPFSHVFDI